MTDAHATTLAALNVLRAQKTIALRALAIASQDGTTADWNAARIAARPACDAVSAEERRIQLAGFGGDLDFEFAVLGRLQRRHEAASLTTREVSALLHGRA